MRSRYTAYVVGNIDYIGRTHDSSVNADFDSEAARQWSQSAKWLGLEIIRTELGQPGDATGVVEFKAHYRIKDKEHVLYEIANFVSKQNIWYYLDGKPAETQQYRREAPKVGRNAPCVCGSGEKYKKCCGSNKESAGKP